MVIFFFSGACAAAPRANARASSAAAARMNGFMSPPVVVRASETDAELGGERRVAAHAIRLEREVRAHEVELGAEEGASLVHGLVGEARVLRRPAHAHDAGARVGREDGE